MARLTASLHPKLTDSVITILQSKRIYTVFDLVPEDSEKIMQYSGLTYQEILDLKQKIMRLYTGGIRKGLELLRTNYNNVIRTEIKSLDILLKGGLRGGEIYEICGLPSSGKSQLCHTVAVNIAQKLNGIVNYLDTKGDFSGKRAQAIVKSKNSNKEYQGLVLDNIMVTRIERKEELMSFLHNIIKKLKKQSEINNKSIKLVVIDSLPAIFFNHEIDSAIIYSAYTSELNHFSNVLRCIANEYNVALMTINLLTQWRENIGIINGSKFPLIRKPALGKYWNSIPNTRLLIETTEFEKRKITVWKSSRLPSGSSCSVEVTNAGVV